MKKLLVLGIIILFIGTGIVSGFDNYECRNIEKNLLSLNDELDQQQTICDVEAPVGYAEGVNCKLAQSFTPQKNILTRIFIFTGRIGQPYPFKFAIRKELDGENLTTISLNYNNFLEGWFGWVEFNFNDIPVIAGEKYYMVMSTRTKSNTIYWIGAGIYDPYSFGSMWVSFDWEYWDESIFKDVDVCFKTYGIGGPPNKPSVPSGRIDGSVNVEYNYNSTAIDPDEDQIYYLFDWGDGTDSGWVGPYNSGTTCSASHAWTKQGNYDIKVKVKDVYDAVSPWSDPLSVTMPRSRLLINPLFMRLLERFPNAFPLLRQMLGL